MINKKNNSFVGLLAVPFNPATANKLFIYLSHCNLTCSLTLILATIRVNFYN